MTTIQLREADADLARAFPVLVQLRPHLRKRMSITSHHFALKLVP